MIIKCMALWQPWATLWCAGVKTIETRPMYSSHRGITGIHATQDPSQYRNQNEEIFYSDDFYPHLSKLGYKEFRDLPRGGIIGAADIIAWKKMVLRKPLHPMVEMELPVNSLQARFGNYQPGRYGIFAKEIFKFTDSYPARGQQNLLFDIDVPKELLEQATVIPIQY